MRFSFEMTLHDAIAMVLSEVAPRGLSVTAINGIIKERDLYRQRNGDPLSLQQTHARIRHYPNLFEVDRSNLPAVIRLRQVGARVKPEPLVAVGPKPADREWYWEGNIQARIQEHLEAAGWTLLESADTETRAQGIDLLLAKGDMKRVVEVKGYPATTYARGPHKGDPKPTQPNVQARHWFAGALLTAILLQERMPEAEVFLGFPDVQRYRGLLTKTDGALRRLGLRVYLVTEAGRVLEFQTPA